MTARELVSTLSICKSIRTLTISQKGFSAEDVKTLQQLEKSQDCGLTKLKIKGTSGAEKPSSAKRKKGK